MKSKYIVVLVLLVTCLFYTQVYYTPASNNYDSEEFNRKIKNFPRQIGDWQYQGDIHMDEVSYKALDPQALIFRRYANSRGKNIVMTIVYHENNRWGAHDVKVCYTSQGWSLIKQDGLNTRKIRLENPPITVNKMEIENSRERVTVFYWWFTQGKQHVTTRLQQMINNVSSSLLYGYCASGLVRISTEGVENNASATLSSFIEQLMPVLDDYLP